MSIETEFQSTIQNVQNAYNGLNNLGATIPQNKTIENIKSCLDEIYDNLPKTSYQTGTEVTLENCLKGKLDFEEDNGKKVVGIGQTEQDGTPTPSTPIAINSVTGNQDVVVSGKNLYNEPSSFNVTNYYICDCKIGDVFTFSFKGYANADNRRIFVRTYNGEFVSNLDSYVDQQTFFLTTSETSYNKTITCTTNGIVYFRLADGASKYTISNVMLEKGNQATTYEPYITPTSYQLSLGDIELNAIGDYKDELVTDRSTGKWYKLKNVEKLTLNGTEDWQNVSNRFFIWLNGSANGDYKVEGLCNSYYEATSVSTHGNQNNSFVIGNSNWGANKVRISFCNNSIASVSAWKSNLASNNITLYYAITSDVGTPELIPITDTTLITQLEAWYNTHSNNGTTIIEGNGNLPMVIKVRALKGE